MSHAVSPLNVKLSRKIFQESKEIKEKKKENKDKTNKIKSRCEKGGSKRDTPSRQAGVSCLR